MIVNVETCVTVVAEAGTGATTVVLAVTTDVEPAATTTVLPEAVMVVLPDATPGKLSALFLFTTQNHTHIRSSRKYIQVCSILHSSYPGMR